MRLLLLLTVFSAVTAGTNTLDRADIKAIIEEAIEKRDSNSLSEERWEQSLEPVLTALAERAKNFVTAHKDEFDELSEKTEAAGAVLLKCLKCAADGDCSPGDNVLCKEQYDVFSKVYEFVACMESDDRKNCIKTMKDADDNGNNEEGSSGSKRSDTQKRRLMLASFRDLFRNGFKRGRTTLE